MTQLLRQIGVARALFASFNVALLVLVNAASAAEGKSETKPTYDARLSNYAYPFSVKTFSFSSQGQPLEMAYMHLQGDENQPTVVLLHGKNFAADYWEKTAAFLHGKGYSVLMPDQIGFGKSTKPAHYQFSLPALAHNTHALVTSLGIKQPIVMGHSMGGMLAMRYSLMYGKNVQRLVLVNPIGLEDYLDYVEYKDVAFFYANERDKTVEDVREYQRKHYYDGKWRDAYEDLIEIHKGWINGDDWQRVAWNNALTYDMIFTGSVVDELDELQVPTTLIIGTRDTTGPGRGWKKPGVEYTLGEYDKLGKRTAERIPNAELLEIPGVGHLPQFEAFDAYVKHLEQVF